MNRVTECDKVFEVLTRGPFPTGGPIDRRVESHLTRCEECRRLAEALRPALDLFQEEIHSAESDSLPSYLGPAVSAPTPWLSRQGQFSKVAVRCQAPPRKERPWLQAAQPFVTYGMAVAAGLCLACLMYFSGLLIPSRSNFSPPFAESPSAPNQVTIIKAGHEAEQDDWAARWSMNQGCVLAIASSKKLVPSDDLPRPELTAALDQLACCTKCHASGKPGPKLAGEKLAIVGQTCQVCHR